MHNPHAIVPAVNVALLYQTRQLEGHLRDALKELGAAVVYEALAAHVDRDALEGSGAHVVIVNLDPEVEAHLDEVYDLIDDDRYNVVFNDAQVSSGLSGWDQARWARHLAAKILGRPDVVDPPRPEGSEAPRSPAQRIAELIPDATSPVARDVAPTPETPSAPSPYRDDRELNAALDALLARADTEPGPTTLRPAPPDPGSVAPPPQRVNPTADLARDLDQKANVTAAAKPAPPPPPTAPPGMDFTAELDALVGTIPSAGLGAKTPPPAAPSAFNADLDALLQPTPAPAARTSAPAVPEPDFGSDLAADLDALFATADSAPRPQVSAAALSDEPEGSSDLSFDMDLADLAADLPDAPAEPASPAADDDLPALEGDFPSFFDQFDAPAEPEPAPAAKAAPAKPAGSTLSGLSLEPLSEGEEDAPGAAPADKPKPSSYGVEKVSAEAFLSGKDWSLSSLEDEESAAAPAAAADFGVEKMAAQEYLAPEGGDESKFKFDTSIKLDLVPIEEAIAPDRPETVVEHRLGDAVIGTPKGVVRRVIVLGASIGGPEAVREYLAAIPAQFPALFLLAQHMGAEFLELMSAQLAKATPLTVRNPSHGERVGHGEVVVVPTTHRLLVDADGVIQLAHLPEASPYSPSIDQVLNDVADRFGQAALAIVFSGMAHDAIEGSKKIAAKGGLVWAQDPDTCVISSMVDGAREAGVVKFLGSPAQLAQQTIATFGGK